MASRTIFTEVVRLSHVHLKEKKSFNEKDKPAFMLTLMAPKNGVGVISKTGLQFHSNLAAIEQAIKEVCLEEFKFEYNPATIVQMGIQHPPTFKDGDMKFQKDANNNPIPGVPDPITKGFNLLKVKNENPVGCVGPDARDIDPSAIYSGCWGKVQVEVSAFTTKSQPPARILSVKLLNVQMAYDDEAFGRGPAQSASQAFAGSVIGNSNIAAGTGQVMAPISAPTMPTAPVAPGSPVAALAPVYVHTATDFTEAQYRATPGFTTEVLVAQGKGRMEVPKPAAPTMPVAPVAPTMPVAPNAPVMPVAPVTPVAPAAPVYVHTATDFTEAQYRATPGFTTEVLVAQGKGYMQSTPAAPVAPVAPTAPVMPTMPVAPVAPIAPAIPLTGKVIMKPDSPFTYQQLTVDYKWTDDQIITAGYATPNFTNPA